MNYIPFYIIFTLNSKVFKYIFSYTYSSYTYSSKMSNDEKCFNRKYKFNTSYCKFNFVKFQVFKVIYTNVFYF